MINFKELIINKLHDNIPELEIEEIERLVETPPSYDMGDYAFPVFQLAKIFRKAPPMIATELAEKLQDSEYFEKVEALGAYVNFFVNKNTYADTVLTDVLEKGYDYGKSDLGANRRVIVEYSSPNIAKPFHIGHIRTTVIGNSIKKIYDYLGYDTIAINHLGDYGTQFGMLITAMKHWGDEEVVRQDPIRELLKLYVKINEEMEEDPTLREETREWFKKLEDKDPEAVRLWNFFREESIKEFERVYELLDIEFDSYAGEAFYSDYMDDVINEIEDKGLTVESQGAEIVDLEEYGMPPLIVKKSDGTTIYATRDLTAAIYRKNKYDFYKNIYVVGNQQKLHFQQFFKVLELMGHEWAKDCVHVEFGTVSTEDGALSTRKGNVLFLEDVLMKAKDGILEILNNREREIENKDKLAEQIGIGAVIFQELFNDRIKDYVFDWDKTLSFEGDTGPYVQYTHARIHSLLEKGAFNPADSVDFALLSSEEELDILRLIYNFQSVVIDAHEKYQPYFVTRHIVELAKAFNKYYNTTSILVDDEEVKKARLALSYGAKVVIHNGLGLLGMVAPERM
ncbi:MAG: arginine--tRNA ligase [Tissierellia bacterium]|nr:arginine--tRNA ligase [Tissierellia bacterium]